MVTRFSIPFNLPEVYHGLAEGHGRAHVDEHGLRLEYRVEDAVIGMLKSKVREMRIRFSDIDEVRLDVRWFRCRMILHLHSMLPVADFPVSKSGRIELRFAREHRDRAREFHSYLSLQISEQRLREIENDD
jgi:hypothetical protein